MPYKYNKEIADKILEFKPSLRSHVKRRVRITEKLVLQLFQQYKLAYLKFAYNYKMSISGDEGTMGSCSKDIIMLSFYFVVWAKDITRIKRELLHQICHALVGVEHSHNQKWIDKAEEIGVNKIKKYIISNRRCAKHNAFQYKLNNLSKSESSKLKLIEEKAILLMQKHQIGHYKFKINDDSRFIGLCSDPNHTISINLSHALNDDESKIENTILHEIAHAIVGVCHGHRKIWQDKAKELGVIWTKKYQQ